MSKEKTPITAEMLETNQLIKLYFINGFERAYQEFEYDDLLKFVHNLINAEREQYAQAKVEELQKENKHLKQVYEHRCNEVKDKVETIHNYLNQITQLQKEIELYENFLTDLSLNHALIHQISLFKESLTNKKEG